MSNCKQKQANRPQYLQSNSDSGDNPTVHVVIPVFNRLEKTLLCLECLKYQTYPAIKIVVVDDGSADRTASVITEKYPDIHLITTRGNRWWTGSTNDGISYVCRSASPSDYVLLLNNDVTFDPGLVSNLVEYAMAQTYPCLIGAVIANKLNRNVIMDGGVRINWWSAKKVLINYKKHLSAFLPNHTEEVSVLTGRGVLYPLKAFLEHGLFDDVNFKQCGDYSLPAFLKKHNYTLVILYNAVVYAEHSDTANINCSSTYKVSQWRDFFFGTKSNCNLRYRFYIGKYGASFIQFPVYICCDVTRIVANFLRRVSWTE